MTGGRVSALELGLQPIMDLGERIRAGGQRLVFDQPQLRQQAVVR
jgi:hypothetical protein